MRSKNSIPLTEIFKTSLGARIEPLVAGFEPLSLTIAYLDSFIGSLPSYNNNWACSTPANITKAQAIVIGISIFPTLVQ